MLRLRPNSWRVAEPLLTGLVRAGDGANGWRGRNVDLFSTVPLLPEGKAPQPEAIEIDFGPARQTFLVGPASVAVPAVPAGLGPCITLRQESMSRLVEPAARAA